MSRIAELSNPLIATLWAIWLIGWTAAAFNVKRTRRRESLASAAVNRIPVTLGMLMLVLPRWLPASLTRRFATPSPDLAIGALVIVIAGLLFAGWARVHIGRNWSGTLTVKEGHTLITSGPYRWVRHPIYTGVLVALLGTALAIGAPYGFIGAGLVLFGFLIRVRIEEQLMRETFPADYADYSRHTSRLIPGVF
jgi:protein-S-isoprenylcysteine O-methyltransferase Ste14